MRRADITRGANNSSGDRPLRSLLARIWGLLGVAVMRVREECGQDQLLGERPRATRRKPKHAGIKRFGTFGPRIFAAALLMVAGGMVAFSAVLNGSAAARVSSDYADAASSFTWTSPVLIDHQRPYADAIPINDVSCSSPTFCLATTEADGELFTTTTPTSETEGSWSVTQTSLISEGATGYSLAGASCVTEGGSPFCVASGRNFNDGSEPGIAISSTDPSGGPSQWHKASFPNGLTDAPSCVHESSTTLCAIGSGFTPEILVSTEPSGPTSGWKKIEPGFSGDGVGASGVSCLSTSFCAAASFGGEYSSSSEPTKTSSWSTPIATGLENAGSFSCTSTAFCLAAGRNSKSEPEIATTTNPTAGASATWKTSKPTGISEFADDGSVTCQPDGSAPSPHAICFASAGGGTIAVSTNAGSTWTPETFPGVLGYFGPSPVSCPSTSLCVAGTLNGEVTNSTDASSGESATWSPGLGLTEGSSAVDLYEHSCPSISLCVAVDGAGRVMTSTEPAKGGSSWKVEAPIDPGEGFWSLECPSTGLCVASDDDGDILTSTSPPGGDAAWSKPTHIDSGGPVYRLACPSAGLCVGLDTEGNLLTSTKPAGGAGDWMKTPLLSSDVYVDELSCPSEGFCVILEDNGRVLTSTHPAVGASSWSSPESPDHSESVDNISCPEASLCVASAGEDILESTDPAGGASTWSSPAPIGTDSVQNLRCPTASLCVATEGNKVLESTDPAGGASTWSKPAELGAEYINSLRCPYISLCLITDYNGNVYTSTDPGAGIAGWTAGTAVDPGEGITGIACASPTLCVLADQSGRVATAKGADVPENTSLPTITGTAQQGQLLTEHGGSWTNAPKTLSYQWERCNAAGSACGPIFGATVNTYTLAAADVGSTIRVEETASNGAGPGPGAVSNQTATVERAEESDDESEEEPHENQGEPKGGGSGGGSGSAATTAQVTTPAESTPAPVVGRRQTVGPVLGTVSVRLKGSSRFVALSTAGSIPDGSEVDAMNGRVIVTVATTTGTESAEVYGGRFVIEQEHTGSDETHFVLSLPLTGCPRVALPRGSAAAVVSAERGPKSRHLWVSEHGGSWGTNGRYVSTTVEGTHWLTLDECNQSEVQVVAGKVKVQDLVSHKIKTLTAGQHYTAKRH